MSGGLSAGTPLQGKGLDDLRDRAAGALVGLAVGDALGATLESTERDEKPLHMEMTGGGMHRLPAGAWTDETSLALCLADSLIQRQAFVPHNVMRRFLRWWLDGENSALGYCFDIGQTTLEALGRFLRTAEAFAGSRAEETSGNGSIVRLAPVAIFRHGHRDAARNEACAQSSLTHDSALCLEACELLVTILLEALDGAAKVEVLRPRPWIGHPAVSLLAGGAWKRKSRAQIRSGRYVLDTLEAALWAVENAGGFEEALVAAVNLAGDADGVGAVTGQLAGAIWGLSAIPDRWLKPLWSREAIEWRAYALLDAGASNRAYERHACVRAAKAARRTSGRERWDWSPRHPATPDPHG